MYPPREENTALSLPVRSALALLSALLVALSSPGSPLPWLSWFWLVPLGLALNGSNTARSTTGMALLCALAFWAAAVWWLAPALQQFANTGSVVTLSLFALICLLCALPYGLFGLLYGYCQWLPKRAGPWRAAIAMTVVICWIPSLIPGHPVHSQYLYPVLIQSLEIGGLPMLIFIMAAAQWHLVSAIVQWRTHRQRSAWQAFAIATGIMVLLAVYGQWRINTIEATQATAEKFKVGFIQPNFVRKDPIERLFSMSEQLINKHDDIDLLIWPEFPPAYSLTDNSSQREKTLAFSQQHQIDMMVVSGYVYGEKNPGKARTYYNASHLIQNGEVVENYYKRTLVPFFEYLPLHSLLKPYFPDTLRYVPGKEATLFKPKGTVNIIPVICYEVIFADSMREFVAQGGNLIINPVSDTWFGKSSGSIHHFSLALFRTVENRIPWVRASNSGISAVVEASGKVVPGSMTALKETNSVVHTLAINKPSSLYSRWGDWFLYLLTVLFSIDLIFRIRQKQ